MRLVDRNIGDPATGERVELCPCRACRCRHCRDRDRLNMIRCAQCGSVEITTPEGEGPSDFCPDCGEKR